jgi:predicted transposase/invertase (TIGR01784 family)
MLDINDLLEALKTRVQQFPDRSAKWLLENTENLRGLLQIIASDIVECLDFSKVEIKSTTFIPDNLREQESDMVYLFPFRDKDNTGRTSEVLVYILLEHQSTLDRTMGFRLLFICVRYGTANAGSSWRKTYQNVTGDFNLSSRLSFTLVIKNGRRFRHWKR